VTLYDAQAESRAVTAALESFWPGGARAGADRVFFYFGGHGSQLDGNGFLVTYDYEPARPTLTSILMRDLSGRHTENMAAHHVLFALDACSSGLTVKTLQDPSRDVLERKTFRRLSIIRNDTAPKARNVLLAGTEDQPAVYDHGGIFTRALVQGLGGMADLNRDGLIQFVELGLFVKNDVAEIASTKRVIQTADYYKLTAGGNTGEMLFFRDVSRRP
jgi:uncharacterized caspase-like protein